MNCSGSFLWAFPRNSGPGGNSDGRETYLQGPASLTAPMQMLRIRRKPSQNEAFYRRGVEEAAPLRCSRKYRFFDKLNS